jgi:hypothetical protein
MSNNYFCSANVEWRVKNFFMSQVFGQKNCLHTVPSTQTTEVQKFATFHISMAVPSTGSTGGSAPSGFDEDEMLRGLDEALGENATFADFMGQIESHFNKLLVASYSAPRDAWDHWLRECICYLFSKNIDQASS